MAAIILGNPTDIQTGSVVPVQVPAYEAEEAVIVLSDGYNPYIIEGGGGGSSDSYWFRYTSGLLRPITVTDKIVIGGTSLYNTESLRVVGKIHSTSIQLGSSVTISSILDEDDMASNSNTAIPTQQSVKSYVDSQVGGFLQAGDNISLLTNNVPYLTDEYDPLFTSSVAYNITSTNISDWNTAFGWGDWSTQGFLTSETDPVFVASIAYGITSDDITNWNTAYTDSHTHSNKTLLDSLITTGASNFFLSADGTYKVIDTVVAGDDTEIQFNNDGAFGSSANFTINTTTNTLSALNLSVGNSIYIGGTDSYIADVSGDLTFTDINAGSITLSALVSGATNYWLPITDGIYYDGGFISNHVSPTAELDIIGHIVATDFDSNYFKYKNSNLLLGPNAGDNETGDNLLYIANSDTAIPLVKGDFVNQMIEFNADTYINSVKRLCFGSSEVYVRRDSTTDDLLFSDPNTNSGDPVKLSDFVRDASLYSLKSDFTQYSAVTSITNANKTTWNKSSVLITTGDGLSYLADDGTYKSVAGGVTPTDYTFKWDLTNSYYRPYTDKTEAGGALSAGKFYLGTINPTATNRLNYDGILQATMLVGIGSTGYGISGSSTSGVGITGGSTSNYGISATSISGGAIYGESQTGLCARLVHDTGTSDVISAILRLEKIESGTANVTENIIEITDNPTTTGTISGALITGIIGTTERLRFDPRVVNGSTAVAHFFSTLNDLSTTGAKILSVRNQNTEVVNITKLGLNTIGKINATGLVESVGNQLTPTSTNPGSATTLWSNSSDSNSLYYNTDKVGKAVSSNNTYNPANPIVFNKDYQYNDYTLTANITPTNSLTGAVALTCSYINIIGDGVHTVDFTNFDKTYNSQAFDITDGAVNTVLFYYDGTNVLYTIQSGLNDKVTFAPNSTNPGGDNTLWVNSADGDALYYGDTAIGQGDNIYLPSTGHVYLGSSTADGSWRILINGTGLEFQRRESSTWVMKQTIEA